jgi:hypothetical protein
MQTALLLLKFAPAFAYIGAGVIAKRYFSLSQAKVAQLLFYETFAQPEHPRLKYQKPNLKIDFLLKFLKTQAKTLVLQFKMPVLKAFHPPQADLCHRFTQ